MADPVTATAAASTALNLGAGFVAIGAGIAVGLSALATAWAQSTIGAAAMGLLAEKDGKEGNVLIYLALPETMIVLGFVVAFLIITNLK